MDLFCVLAYSDLLQPVKDAHPGIGYADLWALAAVVAVKEMGEYCNAYIYTISCFKFLCRRLLKSTNSIYYCPAPQYIYIYSGHPCGDASMS
jgi:hypothetical protein